MDENGAEVAAMLDDLAEAMAEFESEQSSEHEDDGDGDHGSPTFDISLPATHAYMGGMQPVCPSEVMTAGWRGSLPALGAHSLVFISETVPLRLPKEDADLLDNNDHLFALVFADESGIFVSSDGVLCETFERSEEPPGGGAAGGGGEGVVTLKVRATHRLRILNVQHKRTPHKLFYRPRKVHAEVLGESACLDPLQHIRLPSVNALRRSAQRRAIADRMDAALTPWPSVLYEMYHCDRLQTRIKEHFKSIGMSAIPTDPFALSVWAARHTALAARGRRRLWNTTGTIDRLSATCLMLQQAAGVGTSLCCTACGVDVSGRNAMFAMSSDGAHSHYTNPGGYNHDIVTVRTARHVRLSGAPSAEYSWFPGYTWCVIVCAHCHTHLGWRFNATKSSLRPHTFYGLCRNYVTPSSDIDHVDSDEMRETAVTPVMSPDSVFDLSEEASLG